MWEEGERDALMVGLTFESYWNLTPRQYLVYLEYFEEKEKVRIQETDAMNHLLGAYMRIAFNEPSSYPDRPFLSEAFKKMEITSPNEEYNMEEEIKRLNLLFGGIEHGTDSSTITSSNIG